MQGTISLNQQCFPIEIFSYEESQVLSIQPFLVPPCHSMIMSKGSNVIYVQTWPYETLI